MERRAEGENRTSENYASLRETLSLKLLFERISPKLYWTIENREKDEQNGMRFRGCRSKKKPLTIWFSEIGQTGTIGGSKEILSCYSLRGNPDN